jgi:CRP-like cAMP-binding protein
MTRTDTPAMADMSVGFLTDAGAPRSRRHDKAESDVCYRISTDAFAAELDRHGELRTLIRRYAQALLGVVMQSTACNAVHSVEQRLARWLLMAHDRVKRDEFPLTQEFAL